MILNETPIRTSKNFNMNNIKIENLDIPEEIVEFKNTKIKNQNLKIDLDCNLENCNLKYGLGKELTEKVLKNANQKIKITVSNQKDEENEIIFEMDEENKNLLEYIEITAEEKSKTTIIIKYKTDSNYSSFHNGIINLLAKKDSNIKIIIVNLMNTKSSNLLSFQNNIEENANVSYTIIDFGAKNSITNYYSNLQGNKSQNELNTIYLGTEDALFDINYIGELRGKESQMNIEVQGALKDQATKHFKGTLDFKQGCKKAKGDENEFCMLLSDKAKSLALPILLCSEEDVEGNHSTATGKVDKKELFYIMSRGFTQKEAQKLLVKAKFNKIIEKIKNQDLKEEILKEIDKKLD